MKTNPSLPLALAGALACAPAQAQQHVMRVDLGNLKLGTRSGAALAAQRISDAAVIFCRAPSPARRGREGAVIDVTTLKCRRDMARRAVVSLGDRRVSAAFFTSAESW